VIDDSDARRSSAVAISTTPVAAIRARIRRDAEVLETLPHERAQCGRAAGSTEIDAACAGDIRALHPAAEWHRRRAGLVNSNARAVQLERSTWSVRRTRHHSRVARGNVVLEKLLIPRKAIAATLPCAERVRCAAIRDGIAGSES